MHTLEHSLKRTRDLLTIFRERTDNERRQFAILRFLRSHYQLFNLVDDPYLSPKFFKAPTRQLILLQRSGSTHYVLVLNPKSCIAPHVTDSVSTHPLHKEWELMRRILVEVGKPTIYQGEI